MLITKDNALNTTPSDTYYSNSAEERIELSNLTCWDKKLTGESVLIHELGHAVSHFMKVSNHASEVSMGHLLNVRSCLSKNYLDIVVPSSNSTNYPVDLLTTEEDWADLVSFQTTQSYRPLFCRYVDLDRIEKKDLVQIMGTTHGYEFINPNDSHSTGIFRLLHEITVKGWQVPQSCKEVVSYAKEKNYFQIKDCRWEK